jgi:putative hydrolase of HD superfamily
MKSIVHLLFEARILKTLPRSGYQFLGAGNESVAEHSFLITFIAYAMSRMTPEADGDRMIAMCLVHDLPESRIGDQNYVNKKYVRPDEEKAVRDLTAELPFGAELAGLIAEFNAGETLEARLARDADQLALILDLKALKDVGYRPPEDWLPPVLGRLQTETGRRLAETILETPWDAWWRKAIEDG